MVKSFMTKKRNKSGMDKAKKNKADEFYTQYKDIEKELNFYIDYNPEVFKDKTVLLPCDDPGLSNFTKYFIQNFKRLGLKKLISTSYIYDGESNKHGKIYTLTNQTKSLDITNLKCEYLVGDGDFRSDEVKVLRDDADFIITNPPFSKFREFLSWIVEANKKFIIIGNINCITYKEVFPLIKDNKIWLGNGLGRWISGFIVPPEYKLYGTETQVNEKGENIIATNNCLWLTNVEHGRRHTPIELHSLDDNIKSSKHKEIRTKGYCKYDNYDAIEVPFTDAIPSDYDGVMGVPITFLDKYCPEQFEIIKFRKGDDDCDLRVNGKTLYFRILIRHKSEHQLV